MCGPAAAPIALGISAAMSAVSAVQQASAQRKQGKYQQQVAEAQATERDNAARDVLAQAYDDEVASRFETGRLKAEQVARYAAAGVDTSSGSPLRVVEDTAFFGEIDALRIKTRGAKNAEAGFRQAEIDRMSGRNAVAVANSKARSTLLGGATKVAGTVANGFGSGVF